MTPTDGTPEDVEDLKARLRRRIRVERRARGDARAVDRALTTTALRVPEIRRCVSSSGTVALYASLPHEPATTGLRAALRRGGVRVILPVVLTGARLDWIEDDGLVAPGIAPAEAADPARALGADALALADLALVPALAADTAGRRLGQGGGYYDRALAVHRPGLVVAVVHDEELLDAAVSPLPVDGFDRPVDGVLTPARWVRFSSPRAADGG